MTVSPGLQPHKREGKGNEETYGQEATVPPEPYLPRI